MNPNGRSIEFGNKMMAQIIAVIVAVVVIGIIMIPIVNAVTTTTEIIDIPGIENPDPIGDLRLSMSNDTALDLEFEVTVGDDGASVTGSYEASGLTGTLILFGSDDYSLIYSEGRLFETVSGSGNYVNSASVSIKDGEINGVPYTFVYYPSADGNYANFAEYEHDLGDAYAVGTRGSLSIASLEGDIVGSNQYGFTADVQSEGETVTGVEYTMGGGE